MSADRNRRRIPDATVSWLPVYLRILGEQADEGVDSISSERRELAGVNAAKVRKDLSYLGSYGTVAWATRSATSCRSAHWASPTTGRWSSSAPEPGSGLAFYGGFGERLPVAGCGGRGRRQVGSRSAGAVRHIDELPQIVRTKRVNIGVVATPPTPPRTPPTAWSPPVSPASSTSPPWLAVPGHRGPQGGPRRGTADPQLPRAAQASLHAVSGGAAGAVPVGRAQGVRRMSIVVIGVNHRTAPSPCWSACRSRRRCARLSRPGQPRQHPRGRRPLHLQPHWRSMRSDASTVRTGHPRLLLRAWRPAARRSAPHLCCCVSTRRWPTCSRWPPT